MPFFCNYGKYKLFKLDHYGGQQNNLSHRIYDKREGCF